MNWSFKDKVAIVTGAGAGMGLATARAFAEAGATVVLADLREASAHAAAENLVGAGRRVVAIGCDIADDAQVAAMVDWIVATFGRLDAAFNTAGGMSPHSETAELGNGARDRMIAAGLRGISNCTNHELRQMRRQGGGAIVNCACIDGPAGCLGSAGSIASTHGANGLTDTAAMDAAANGIRVTEICLDPIIAPVLGSPNHAAIGCSGEPEEIARAVLWLCSPWARHVMGIPSPWMAAMRRAELRHRSGRARSGGMALAR